MWSWNPGSWNPLRNLVKRQAFSWLSFWTRLLPHSARGRYNMKPSFKRICCLNSWFPYIEEALAHPSFTISLDSDLHDLSTRPKLEDWPWGRWMKDISTGHLQRDDILCVDMLCCAILLRVLLLQKGGLKISNHLPAKTCAAGLHNGPPKGHEKTCLQELKSLVSWWNVRKSSSCQAQDRTLWSSRADAAQQPTPGGSDGVLRNSHDGVHVWAANRSFCTSHKRNRGWRTKHRQTCMPLLLSIPILSMLMHSAASKVPTVTFHGIQLSTAASVLQQHWWKVQFLSSWLNGAWVRDI